MKWWILAIPQYVVIGFFLAATVSDGGPANSSYRAEPTGVEP
ncbi:hypothetical protein [Streptomyces albiflavescens]|nr:hypothetical protein [Streptomyces albiflavescens]